MAFEGSYQDKETVKFGEHLIFDAYGCNPEKLDDVGLCIDVLNKLVELAEMRKLTEPYVVKAGSNETLGGKDPGGNSGFVMIQESHISLHSFTKRGFITIDVYSCKEFATEAIIAYLKRVFEPKDVDIVKMDRGLKYPAGNLY